MNNNGMYVGQNVHNMQNKSSGGSGGSGGNGGNKSGYGHHSSNNK